MNQKLIFDKIYNQKILSLAANITHLGKPERYDICVEKHSLVCGARFCLYLSTENQVITDYRQEIESCLLGQASAALLAKHAIGRHFQQLEELAANIKHMLKTGEIKLASPFEEFAVLAPIKELPTRQEAVLLIFDTMLEAIKQRVHK